MRMKKKMYSLLLLLGILWSATLCAQVTADPDSVIVGRYFETIRQDENRLRQFFAQMPKGGDLHNHLTGSAYAETYFRLAAEDMLWVDMATGKLYQAKAPGLIQLSPNMKNLHNTRMALIDKWSVRNFNPEKFSLGPDEYFFGTFGLFGAVTGKHNAELMRELRERAAYENVQYLEIMVSSPGINAQKIDEFCGTGFFDKYNSLLLKAIQKDAKNPGKQDSTTKILNEIYSKWYQSKKFNQFSKEYVKQINSIDDQSTISSNLPLCYYQSYASRNSDPLVVFAQLYVAYLSCLEKDSKVVGVNIVAAENGEVSIRDYTAHMKMFNLLDAKTTKPVNTSLHAGELTLGLVEPENMRHHINEAVFTAKAKRIGHGVDIAFEEESIQLLNEMKSRRTAVEINLTSNEFILGVKNDAHPFMLYRKAGVPVVISTDDPGILRTNLTQQYVLAAMRYGLSYYEIKELVRNSIRYGFMPANVKQNLARVLESKFTDFEKKWRGNAKIISTWRN